MEQLYGKTDSRQSVFPEGRFERIGLPARPVLRQVFPEGRFSLCIQFVIFYIYYGFFPCSARRPHVPLASCINVHAAAENFCDVVAEGGGGPRAADLAEAAFREMSSINLGNIPKNREPKTALRIALGRRLSEKTGFLKNWVKIK